MPDAIQEIARRQFCKRIRERGVLLGSSLPATEAGEIPTDTEGLFWIEACRVIKDIRKGNRKITLTKNDFESIILNFKSNVLGRSPFVDVDHLIESGEGGADSRARLGEIVAVKLGNSKEPEVDGETTLMIGVKLNSLGVEAVKDKRYGYASAAIFWGVDDVRPGHEGEKIKTPVLSSVALTATPVVPFLAPVGEDVTDRIAASRGYVIADMMFLSNSQGGYESLELATVPIEGNTLDFLRDQLQAKLNELYPAKPDEGIYAPWIKAVIIDKDDSNKGYVVFQQGEGEHFARSFSLDADGLVTELGEPQKAVNTGWEIVSEITETEFTDDEIAELETLAKTSSSACWNKCVSQAESKGVSDPEAYCTAVARKKGLLSETEIESFIDKGDNSMDEDKKKLETLSAEKTKLEEEKTALEKEKELLSQRVRLASVVNERAAYSHLLETLSRPNTKGRVFPPAFLSRLKEILVGNSEKKVLLSLADVKKELFADGSPLTEDAKAAAEQVIETVAQDVEEVASDIKDIPVTAPATPEEATQTEETVQSLKAKIAAILTELQKLLETDMAPVSAETFQASRKLKPGESEDKDALLSARIKELKLESDKHTELKGKTGAVLHQAAARLARAELADAG